MKTFNKKHLTLMSILFLPLFVIVLWQFPFATPILGITFLLFSLALAISSVFKKHRDAYHQGKITRGVFMRNVFLEIFCILFTMTLAGLLGRYIAEVATAQITNDIARLIAGILIGLLAGVCIAILVKRTWGWLLKA